MVASTSAVRDKVLQETHVAPLDQSGRALDHGRDALVVPPGRTLTRGGKTTVVYYYDVNEGDS